MTNPFNTLIDKVYDVALPHILDKVVAGIDSLKGAEIVTDALVKAFGKAPQVALVHAVLVTGKAFVNAVLAAIHDVTQKPVTQG